MSQVEPSSPVPHGWEHLSADERALRRFDLCLRYGPASGITRLERWKRAEADGLNPPQALLPLIQAPGAETLSTQTRHLERHASQ
jgi:hypothetical protein